MDDNEAGWKVLERAKSKRQTEPRTKEKSEAEHLYQCGTMTQISPQDTFNTLLSFLKSEPLNWLSVPLHCPSLASAEGRDKFLKLAPTMVKVMESEIFYQGGLKGGICAETNTNPTLSETSTNSSIG